MARVKLTEFRAKSLLVPDYTGIALQQETLADDCEGIAAGSYVVKVDEGVKKRGKQGLLRLNVAAKDIPKTTRELARKGYRRFVAEPMFPHEQEEERYVCFELTRDGYAATYSPHGGMEVEEHSESLERFADPGKLPLPQEWVQHILGIMREQHLSFVEFNPLVVRGDNCFVLDAAVLGDSAAENRVAWTNDDVVDARQLSAAEQAIAELNENSPAAFSFRVLNPDGALWLLLSGGGASITIADEAQNHGKARLIGNYGEYSGGPTTEETYLYTKEVLDQMFRSKAPKKALVIAGGVANFTDVKKTFAGVIQALDEVAERCRKEKIKVFVRRGGPNEVEGLAMMERFLEENKLFGSVHGSDIVLTEIINEALEYVDA